MVGHSLYFKCMLGLESKFHNVDVWSIQFDFTVENSAERVKEDVHVANESEKKKKIQKRLKHLETIGSMIPHGDNCGKYGNMQKEEEDGDEKKDDSATDGFGESESRDKNDGGTAFNAGIQTEFDGVSLDDLTLPRGWTQLRHHYRFDPHENDCE